MAVRDDRGDEKQTTTGFRGPLMVQSLTSAKSKFLSLLEPALQRSRAWKSESVCSLYFVVLHIQFSRKKYLTLEATFGGHL